MTMMTAYGRWDGGTLLTDDGVVLDLTGILQGDFEVGNDEAMWIVKHLREKKDKLYISSVKLIPGQSLGMEITFDAGKVVKHDVKALVLQAAFQTHDKKGAPEFLSLSLDPEWGDSIVPAIINIVKL